MAKAFVAVLMLLLVATTEAQVQLAPASVVSELNIHAHASFAAYCSSTVLSSTSGMVDVVTNVLAGTQVYVMKNNNRLYVVFRGSQNYQNFVQDIDATYTTLPWSGVAFGVRVHRGFSVSYDSLRTELLQVLSAAVAACPSCDIHVTGHSLGGAQALLCAVDLRLQGYDVMLWTFGQPRVGNSAFANMVNTLLSSGKSYRVVNNRDNVPQVPTTGYEHHAREIWMRYGLNILCDGTGEDLSCSKSVALLPSALDHLGYVSGTCTTHLSSAF